MESTELTTENPQMEVDETLHEQNAEVAPEIENEAGEGAIVDTPTEPQKKFDIFGNEIVEFVEEPPSIESQLPDELKELLELGKKVKNNELAQNILNAEEEGETPENVVKKLTFEPYSADNPERVFKDYLKMKMPDATEYQIEAAWEKKLGGEDELDAFEMLTIQSQAEELNKLRPQPKWGGKKVDPEVVKQQQAAAVENVEKFIAKTKGARIMANNGEGGFEINDKHIEKGLEFARDVFSGKYTNQDGTVNHRVLHALTLYANIEDIFNTLKQSWTSEGKVEILANQSNLTPITNRTQAAPPKVTKGQFSKSEQFQEAQRILEERRNKQ